MNVINFFRRSLKNVANRSKKIEKVLKRRAPWINDVMNDRRKKELGILYRNLKWKVSSLVREYRVVKSEIKNHKIVGSCL